MAGAKYLNLFAGLLILTAFMLTGATGVNAAEQTNETPQLIKDIYPILTNGMLNEARLSVLPAVMLLQAGSLKITDKDLQAEVAKAPEELRSQLTKNAFLILENRATRELLTAEATAWAKDKKQKIPADTSELLKPYFDFLTAGVAVDDKELKVFYDKNPDMMGGATFEQVKNDLKQYILNLKRQDTINAHIASIGKRTSVEVNKTWLEKQYTSAIDNPVDKARLSGKPSFVDFGADGCRPCDMMTPILESVKTEYAGKLNVLFVHVRKEQILAARYGIESIPVQVFFDKDGKEIFRHTGFFPREQIVSKLAEIGVK
ncbi:MAG: thioredoxin family protein [bacterium]|jgi:thiol-disulfide isomerase/thioredoxin|nr:thioredoxin family protein [bacterium]